ncbi:MAG: iron chelate uptake ABC transporter family permease subunit, partial [Sandarakinorhabdus sp.]|nr:iron chelate uptake ABC transporter family permease subunit [Sandarakinorhabdus sp.]
PDALLSASGFHNQSADYGLRQWDVLPLELLVAHPPRVLLTQSTAAHLVRPFAGHRPSAVLLPSAIGGALLLVLADSLVRIAPTVSELRLGIAMSMLGGPFFLMLLLRLRRTLP